MRGLKIFLLFLLAILLFANSWIYLAWIGVERTALNSGYYRDLIVETGFTRIVHRELQAALPNMILDTLVNSIIRNMFEENLEAEGENEEREELIKKLKAELEKTLRLRLSLVFSPLFNTFDPVWAEEQLLLAIEDILDLVKGDKDKLTTVIDISTKKMELKQKLIGGLQALPEEKLEEMAIEPEDIEMMVAQIVTVLDIPDQLILAEYAADLPAEADEAFTSLQVFRRLFGFWPYLIFALLLFLFLFLAGASGGLKWFGTVTFLCGAFFIIGLQAVRLAYSAQFPKASVIVMADLPLPPELLHNVVSLTLSRVTAPPAAFAAAGLFFLAGGFLYKKIIPKPGP